VRGLWVGIDFVVAACRGVVRALIDLGDRGDEADEDAKSFARGAVVDNGSARRVLWEIVVRTEAAVGRLYPRRKLSYPHERIVLARRGSGTKARLVLASDGVSFKRPAIEGVDVRYGVEWEDGTIEPMPWTWADWSHRGEFLAATKDGRLVAMKVGAGELEQIVQHDLSAVRPRKTVSPDWAREW
jgi:hypothetical protein